MNPEHVIVVGGGLAGLTSAIRLAEQGTSVTLLEAAPQLGGRTRSFDDPKVRVRIDNGPHLLIGAYTATRKLLRDCDATENIHWQPSLTLPLWDGRRGHFCLRPKPYLPLALALPLAIARLPGHSIQSATALLRLATHPPGPQTVSAWLSKLAIPTDLQRDLLEPLCLGAMNEAAATADARSFARVLKESFAAHKSARLGWFNKPISDALIAPLERRASQLGVDIRLRTRVTSLQPCQEGTEVKLRDGTVMQTDTVVLAVPAHARDLMLGIRHEGETHPITNIHLWFDEAGLKLPAPFIGGIGTLGQWFFDIRQQIPSSDTGHFCVVISAPDSERTNLAEQVTRELAKIGGWSPEIVPRHQRIVTEQRATARVAAARRPTMLNGIIDACEAPVSGELPATIETAIRRGEAAATSHLLSHA